MTLRAGLALSRPPSIMTPTAATAITATLVAAVPSSVPSIHETAAPIALDPAGSPISRKAEPRLEEDVE